MLYIIEDLVCFRTDDGALWTKNDEKDCLILSPIVARLLQLFLQEQGKLLTREEIMHTVWEKHGLEPSNNSLNQYVSQLRKLLSHYQTPDESIRTVPREGFIFSNQIQVRIANEIHYQSKAAENLISEKLKEKKFSMSNKWLGLVALMMVILAPVIVIFGTELLHNKQSSTTPYKIGQLDHCPIYSVLMGRNAKLKETLTAAQKYITDNNVKCIDNTALYFFSTGSALKNQNGRVFLSQCKKKDNKIISCMDYTYHSWK
ncbi:helix-turn-helix domain-containing protein [Enterobacter cloacae complex sp. 2022EL-00788]|uniref:winged helix-turn-helix domain-containing protein n=1 Tax=Enterobacter cloacae complex sp. 2022EL-00788 TaxID=2996512 RepID=UPI00226D7DA0|nr:helix-turn-helix domain-containing protein [Enterobacter cloacae complex sp. 2022EL-00788]MCY0771400.1 helix-turn-helix domain-containing protein [Enterobacter cloacae complex sp. 2022EL-00788]